MSFIIIENKTGPTIVHCSTPLLMSKKNGLISTNSNSLLSACLKISYPVVNVRVNRQLTKLIKKNFMINMIKTFSKNQKQIPAQYQLGYQAISSTYVDTTIVPW